MQKLPGGLFPGSFISNDQCSGKENTAAALVITENIRLRTLNILSQSTKAMLISLNDISIALINRSFSACHTWDRHDLSFGLQ